MHLVSHVKVAADRKQWLRPDPGHLSGRNCFGCAENSRHANYPRTGKEQTRLLRGRGRLFRFRWRARLLHRAAFRGLERWKGIFSKSSGHGVANSNPHSEYEETVNKAGAMAKALAMAKQIRPPRTDKRGNSGEVRQLCLTRLTGRQPAKTAWQAVIQVKRVMSNCAN